MAFKTSPRDFKLFEKTVRFYANKYHALHGWDLLVELANSDTAYASMSYTWEARKVVIRLSTEWPLRPTDDRIKQSARHEVIHLLLARYTYLAEDRYATKKALYAEEEDLVARLLELLPQ